MANELPTGVVTFLMTDVEGSTSLWRDAPEAAALMARQAELIGRAIAKHGGVRPADQGEGDSLLAAFSRPRDALAAALAAQRALHAEAWPLGAALRVRMAVHTGEAELRDAANYGGLEIIRCARLRGLANGGQVLVSSTAAVLAGERIGEGGTLAPLDIVAIPGFDGPERVFQLRHPELPEALLALRSTAAALPVFPTSLVGRERERAEIAALCGAERLVTLTGAGGSGKTRLAHAVAEDLSMRLDGGAVWVELARLADVAQVTGAVALAAGARETPGVDVTDLLVRHFAGREQLLVLDNCEHLLGACAALVDRLLRAVPELRILATSREPLGVGGETSWRVPSLALPEEGERDPERLAEAGAVQLFAARAEAARRDFALDAASAPLVARICRRLDGIPLALELAAARVRTLSLERLADGLDDRFRLLTGGARTAVERQRTLLASVEWSHDLLDEEERTLFRRLSVFAAPFTLDAAEAVAADEDLDGAAVLDLLARLVDKSLVLHEGERYRMLETLRQYAQARGEEAGELALLRDRHLAAVRRRAREWRLDREFGAPRLLAEVTLEAPDLLAAAEWSAAREGRLPSEVLHALVQAWAAPDRFHEARSAGLRLLGALPAGSRAWLEGLAPLANVLVLANELAWQATASEAMAREGDALDPVARGFLEGALWLAPAYFGSAEAQRALEAAAARGREAGNLRLEAAVTFDLAMVRAQTGDPAGARPLVAWLERHVPPDTWLYALARVAHALVKLYEGDLAGARRTLASAGESEGRLAAWSLEALVAFWQGDTNRLAEGLARIERLETTGAFGGIRSITRATLAMLRDDLEEAERAIDAAGGLFGNYQLWGAVLGAQTALARGNVDRAQRDASDVLARTAGTELHHNRASAQLVLAQALYRRGERLEAESYAQAALGGAVRHGMSILLTDALEVLAILAADRGAGEDAARLLGATSAFRERSGYRWAPRHQAEALAALRAVVPAAAFAEGEALSLREAAAYAARGRGERGRPDFGWESLTPSELRVVEEVAAGLSNAAVAKKLFVSLATVKTHLVHVYAKLGLATRAELVAAAAKRMQAD